ncbi:LamG-like jellyroll fold domain-containing protein [Variovorax sp. VaC1]|uniref:LamG-like jellyroll fold domain-containing protein n=1 Tax=Variovorax sp. VaC1 TaxID=3373132 RepID=UPI0037491A70
MSKLEIKGTPMASSARRRFMQEAGALMAMMLPACGGGGGGQPFGLGVPLTSTSTSSSTPALPPASPSSPQPEVVCESSVATEPQRIAARTAFVHPGLLHNEEDLLRMRAKVEAQAQPWFSGWLQLTSGDYASLGRKPNPQETVVRGGSGANFGTMVFDMLTTYELAIRWRASGDTAYADLAVQFLDQWSSKMKTLTGDADRFIAAGLYGYQWANAAEIMRTYKGWPPAGIARFQALLKEVFYPLCHSFLTDHNGTNTSNRTVTNYWGSWDLLTVCGVMAIGVFCDDLALYDEAITYFKSGLGNGAAQHMVYRLHRGHLGQWQESGRDQGHSTLGVACLASACEMAWKQGDDLYGYWNNRALSGAEYVAASNLQDASGAYPDLPFSVYANIQGTFTAVSMSGRPLLRPCWEILYNHYVNRKGLSAPYVSAMAARMRPEKRDTGGDEPSFGTLTATLEPIAAGAAPSGLTTHIVQDTVELDWWGSSDATAYEVQRARAACGPFTALASVAETRAYTDRPGAGTWSYRIAAITPSGKRIGKQVHTLSMPGQPVLHVPLNEGTGSSSADAVDVRRTALLSGGATWTDGRLAGEKAVLLNGSGAFVKLPAGVMANLHDFTLCLWVNATASTKNSWLVAMSSSYVSYFGVLPSDGSAALRSTITGTLYFGEQNVSAPAALPVGRWVHLAVTLSGSTGTLYLDGNIVGTNPKMDFAPYQLGETPDNWLGRSPYPSDPFFKGAVQDLRLYSGALTQAAIAGIAAG